MLDLFSAAELIAPIAERFEGNPHWVMPVDAAQASSLAGVPIEWPALFISAPVGLIRTSCVANYPLTPILIGWN